MKFKVYLAQDEDGVWVAEVVALRGCVSQGDTKEEALKNIQEAALLCAEVRAAQKLPVAIMSVEDFMAVLNDKCEYTVEIPD